MLRPVASALVAAALLAGSGRAGAFERQWQLGLGAGVAGLDERGLGPALGMHAAYGLNDVFDVNAEVLGSFHRESGRAEVFSGAVGVSYKIDIFQWIPYVELAGGAYYFGGDGGPNGEAGLEPGASIGGGLDYLVSRSFSLGAQYRQHASFSDGLSLPYLSATLRGAYRFGW